jgi:molybdopterin-guanine dinucleotide biosynthesis protein B
VSFEGKIVAVVGHKDVGKTRVVEGLVAYLKAKGFSVGTVKHVHGPVALEPKTVDSGRHLAAGATCAVTVSDRMVQATSGLGGRARKSAQAALDEALVRHLAGCDCVIVEGFKALALPKVVVTSGGTQPPRLENVVAYVYRGAKPKSLPAFRQSEVRKLGAFLLKSGILAPGGAAAHLVVNDKQVPMNEFVARALAGVIQGFVGSLRDVESPEKIELTIRSGG